MDRAYRHAEVAALAVNEALHVVHLCAPAHVGGLERVVQELAIGLAGRGHRVQVVTVSDPRTDLADFLQPLDAEGVECLRIDVEGRGYLREWKAVRHILLEEQPDVLHSHGYRADLLHGWTTRALGIATVTTLHGSSRMGGLSHLFEHMQALSLRYFDGVVAVSDPLSDELEALRVPPNRLHKIPNAWTPVRNALSRAEARAELTAPDGPTVLGWVGRLIPIKGCDVLLRALHRLQESGHRQWIARIIGDGPEAEPLRTLRDELELGERVEFVGYVDQAARLLSGFDVYVMSSRSEGTPIALLEAMGAGLPIVATAVGGVPDMLGDGEAGWLTPPESPAALASTLEEVLTDPNQRARRSAAARRRIDEHYSPDHWFSRHEDVYEQAMIIRASGG